MSDEPKTALDRLGIEPVDFRGICRESSVETHIALVGDYSESRAVWIKTGAIEFNMNDSRGIKGEGTLYSYMGQGATDFEHDSSRVFRIPLSGIQFRNVYYEIIFTARIRPMTGYGWKNAPELERSQSQKFRGRPHFPGNPEDEFRFPSTSGNPLEDAKMCDSEHCKEPHPIVEYLPDANKELYRKVAGERIRIMVGQY